MPPQNNRPSGLVYGHSGRKPGRTQCSGGVPDSKSADDIEALRCSATEHLLVCSRTRIGNRLTRLLPTTLHPDRLLMPRHTGRVITDDALHGADREDRALLAADSNSDGAKCHGALPTGTDLRAHCALSASRAGAPRSSPCGLRQVVLLRRRHLAGDDFGIAFDRDWGVSLRASRSFGLGHHR